MLEILLSTAKNAQQGTYVASGTVPANTETTLLNLTCTKAGRYLIIGTFRASGATNYMSLTIKVNGTSIQGSWAVADKSTICVYTLAVGDVVELIARTTTDETFYRDRRNNDLTITEL